MTAATDTPPTPDQANPGAAVATATAPRPPKASIVLGGPQTDFDALYRLASNLSYAQLLPTGLRGKPADVLLIMMYGQELGLSAIQSIQGIYIVNGRPQIAGQTWLAKLTDAGHTYDIEHFEGGCKVTITRGDNGRSHTETFTIDDARTAGLATKDTYRQYPKRMLMWRAVSDCATVICPDVALGFGIGEIAREGGDDARAHAQAIREPGPALAAVVAARQHEQPAPAAEAEPVDAEIVEPVTNITGGTPVPEEEPAKPSQADMAAAYAEMNAAATAAPADPEPVSPEPTDEEYAAMNAEAAES